MSINLATHFIIDRKKWDLLEKSVDLCVSLVTNADICIMMCGIRSSVCTKLLWEELGVK